MDRREFCQIAGLSVIGLVSASLGVLFSAIEVEARERRVSDFLSAYGAIYDPNQEWDHGSGRLLTGISGYSGHLHVYVDNQRITSPVDQVIFDSRSQRLLIRDAITGNVIFDHNPRVRLAPIVLP